VSRTGLCHPEVDPLKQTDKGVDVVNPSYEYALARLALQSDGPLEGSVDVLSQIFTPEDMTPADEQAWADLCRWASQ
jgi:hypothetical protein